MRRIAENLLIAFGILWALACTALAFMIGPG